jgi:Mor family transcriptional regulator
MSETATEARRIRNKAIFERSKSGATLKELAAEFNLTAITIKRVIWHEKLDAHLSGHGRFNDYNTHEGSP